MNEEKKKLSSTEPFFVVETTDNDEDEDDEEEMLLPKERHGDVISSHRALLTLMKGFVGSGCLSLPYAWKEGGLWMSFSLQILISILNWYSNTILSQSSQQLAAKTGRPALDYGHFAKKVFDYSSFQSLRKRSKIAMYVVNVTVLIYQLGCCAVPIVFVSTNLNNIIVKHFDVHITNVQYATILLIPLAISNMIAQMRILSWLAILATFLWFFGTAAMLQECFRMPTQWETLPATTNLWSTVLFIGTAMYAYEGQTMILPIENKLRHPEDFTAKCGVLPTLMILITVFYTAIGFFGYTAYGQATLGTLPLNMPDTTLFTVVTIALTIMAFLAHPINLYVVFEMLWPGFKRKSGNHLLAVSVPKIEQIISLVGVTAGSLCAFCYPAILELLFNWDSWRRHRSKLFLYTKLIFNITLCLFGLALLITGLYVNVAEMVKSI